MLIRIFCAHIVCKSQITFQLVWSFTEASYQSSATAVKPRYVCVNQTYRSRKSVLAVIASVFQYAYWALTKKKIIKRKKIWMQAFLSFWMLLIDKSYNHNTTNLPKIPSISGINIINRYENINKNLRNICNGIIKLSSNLVTIHHLVVQSRNLCHSKLFFYQFCM